jgi:hypothetical protein
LHDLSSVLAAANPRFSFEALFFSLGHTMTYQTSAKVLKTTGLVIATALLSACNSGGTPEIVVVPAQEATITFNDTTATTPSTVAVLETVGFFDGDSTNKAIRQNSGEYNHLTSQVTANGNTVSVEKAAGFNFLTSYDAGSNQRGLAVLTTQSMPTAGTANYAGTASYILTQGGVTATHGDQPATITANFATNNVNMDVTGANTIAVRNLLINNAQSSFQEQSSSTASLTGTAIPVTALGRFGGPTAQEVGAIVHMDDLAGTSVEMAVIAKQ